MKRNVLLIIGLFIILFLAFNSLKKISVFHGTYKEVGRSEQRLADIKAENERLKAELEYKKSLQFKEAEIRNRLGLVKEGETLVIIPREKELAQDEKKSSKSNFEKWMDLFFRGG